MVLIAMRQTAILLILAAVGVLCTKCGMITKERSKGFADLIMYVLTPAVIINSLQIDFDMEHLVGLSITTFASLIGYLVNIFVNKYFIKHKNEDIATVLQFGAVYPNAAYMGIPLIQALLGNEGVFYLTGCIASFNLIAFTGGIFKMERSRSKVDWKHIILSPAVSSIFVGVALFLLQIRLPGIVMEPIKMLAASITPLAMLVAGYSMCNVDFKERSHLKALGIASFWRLLLYPAVYAFLMSLLPGYEIARMTAIICMACPTATVTVFFAVKYDRDDSVATQMFTITTVLSVLTIPIIILLAQLFGVVV